MCDVSLASAHAQDIRANNCCLILPVFLALSFFFYFLLHKSPWKSKIVRTTKEVNIRETIRNHENGSRASDLALRYGLAVADLHIKMKEAIK